MNLRSIGSRRPELLVVILIALSVCAGGSAWAKRRIAVAEFAGKGDSAQRAVSALVQREATLVGPSAVKRAQQRLKLTVLTKPNLLKLATDLGVDAIVTGKVDGGARGYELGIAVIDGRTGAVVTTLAVALRSPQLDAAAKKELAEQLVPALDNVGAEPEPMPVAEPQVEIDPERAPSATAAPAAPVAPVAPPAVEPAPAEPADRADRYSRYAAIDVEIGVSAVVRNLDFNAAPDLRVEQRPNTYSGQPVASLLFGGELYPFAFGGKTGLLSGLGLGVVFDKVLVIKSRLGTTEYDTAQTRWGANLRWRLNFGGPSAPSVKVLAGVSRLTFAIDRGSADLGMPDVAYTNLEFGAAGRVPIGWPNLALFADLRYLAVLDTGEISTKEFYGSGSTLGLAVEGGIELILLRRFVVRAGIRYQRYAFDFDGTGVQSNNLDGNPANQDVGGAVDDYLSGFLTAGYLF